METLYVVVVLLWFGVSQLQTLYNEYIIIPNIILCFHLTFWIKRISEFARGCDELGVGRRRPEQFVENGDVFILFR